MSDLISKTAPRMYKVVTDGGECQAIFDEGVKIERELTAAKESLSSAVRAAYQDCIDICRKCEKESEEWSDYETRAAAIELADEIEERMNEVCAKGAKS